MAREKWRASHVFLLLLVIGVFIWSVIKPAGYLIWTMEVLPGIVTLAIVLALYNKFRLTTLSYLIIAILCILMFIGGHYTYSEVPFFNWIKDSFDLKRNHYDRFGHFLKGMSAIVIRELFIRKSPLKRGPWLVSVVLSISLAIGALYEIIEWISTTIGKGGKTTEKFLGAQGDMWDAQWDMLLTFVGSILTLLLLTKLHNRQLEKQLNVKIK